jgi:hypothetical protein
MACQVSTNCKLSWYLLFTQGCLNFLSQCQPCGALCQCFWVQIRCCQRGVYIYIYNNIFILSTLCWITWWLLDLGKRNRSLVSDFKLLPSPRNIIQLLSVVPFHSNNNTVYDSASPKSHSFFRLSLLIGKHLQGVTLTPYMTYSWSHPT